jgi:uncharacterized YccA/Bax inhibitor family protein
MNEAVYRRAGLADTPTQAMTIPGTVLKTAALVVILLVTAAYTWSQAVAGATTLTYRLLIAGETPVASSPSWTRVGRCSAVEWHGGDAAV